ncbi:hypothetical protein Snoj_04250 [Streptomyces nojiriensis]|uniref:Uncharacterized protein n=1 Tax=Streptomyces nojiriensis TaxID=66374 RepID=A0ABQ3SEE5_9ACTN|nr:hypothetical protein JYK04_06018 [Streptomyces nojiriensis]GGS25776.1 hypothetical protein GCM10010205_64720 [Streptomyces nojiriensis]GHI66507.1 hypothetical protein Snoj_04250 [Streptomyces nojiriensis]
MVELFDIAEWVRRSRAAQALPEKVLDPATVARLAELVHLALETEQTRRSERRMSQTPVRACGCPDSHAEDGNRH